MYVIIRTGGKQYKVEEGETLEVERVQGDELELRPLLLVDGDDMRSTPAELEGVAVRARVVGESRGPKITGFKIGRASGRDRV